MEGAAQQGDVPPSVSRHPSDPHGRQLCLVNHTSQEVRRGGTAIPYFQHSVSTVIFQSQVFLIISNLIANSSY
jgi:hypothetical protein